MVARPLRNLGAAQAALTFNCASFPTCYGSCCKSIAFAAACEDLGLNHIRTKPYPPKTNGKAVRFIQTVVREWACARTYETSDKRKFYLPGWTHMYNWHRPHGSLNEGLKNLPLLA